MLLLDLIAKNSDEKDLNKENNEKKRCNTRTSHRSTTHLAQARLTPKF